MKNFLYLIFFICSAFPLSAQEQIFESTILEEEGLLASKFLELEDNKFFLLAKWGEFGGFYKSRFFIIDGEDGNILQDKTHISTMSVRPEFIEKYNNEYLVLGRAEDDIYNSFLYYGRFNLDFEVIEEVYHPLEIEVFIKLQVKFVNNQFIFIGAGSYPPFLNSFGGIMSWDGELILLNEDIGPVGYLGDFLIRKDSVGYIGFGGGRLSIMDESFNQLYVYQLENHVTQDGSLSYFEDSTILFVGKYWHFPDSVNLSRDIGVGILDNFEITHFDHFATVNTDTTDYPAVLKAMDFVDENNIYVGGTTNFTAPIYFFPPPSQYIVANYDRELNKRWERRYGDTTRNHLMSNVFATTDGGALLFGYSFDNNTDLRTDLYIVKIAGDGTVDSETIIPLSERIKVFPNPATDKINVELPENMGNDLSLKIYSITGQILLEVNDYSGEGIDIRFLPSGNYVLEITDVTNRKKWVEKIVKQ